MLLAAFSYTSYDRTVARGDEKFYCGMDCHIAYSVQNVAGMKIRTLRSRESITPKRSYDCNARPSLYQSDLRVQQIDRLTSFAGYSHPSEAAFGAALSRRVAIGNLNVPAV